MAVPKNAVSQKLVDLYKANEMLWDLSHKDYHNKVKRAAVLQEIGLEIGSAREHNCFRNLDTRTILNRLTFQTEKKNHNSV